MSNDHDLLIEVKTAFDTKMSSLCSTITELKADIKELKNKPYPCIEQSDRCNDKFEEINKKMDNRPKWNQIVTILLILVGITSGVIGFNFNQDINRDEKINIVTEKVIKNEHAIKYLNTFNGITDTTKKIKQ